MSFRRLSKELRLFDHVVIMSGFRPLRYLVPIYSYLVLIPTHVDSYHVDFIHVDSISKLLQGGLK